MEFTRDERIARGFFGVTSLLVTYGLVLQLVLAATNDNGRFERVPARIVTTLSYFTIQSNILVAVTTGLLALRLHRTSTVFRVLRLTALVAIAITGVVFHLALKNLQELTDKAAAADWVLHTASPLLCVAGWLLFGPRRQITVRIVGYAVVFPLAWLAYTLVRGEIVNDRNGRPFYPYPFIDVFEHGYATVSVAIVLVAVLFGVLASLALVLDRRLPGVEGEPAGEPLAGSVSTA